MLAVASVAASVDPAHSSHPIFTGDFRNGDATEWREVQRVGRTAGFEVSTSGPPAGSRAFGRFELHRGDTRSEVSSQLRLFSGADVYFRFKVRLGEGFPAEEDRGTWGQLIWQLHQKSSSGSPPVALHVAGSGTGKFALRGPHGGFWWRGPSIDTAWHQFVIRVKHSTDRDAGFVEVWLDGERQVMANGKSRFPAATLLDAYNYPKIGYYRDDDMVGTGVVDIAGYAIFSGI